MRHLKNALAGILWGYLAGVIYALLMLLEYHFVAGGGDPPAAMIRAFVAMMFFGSRFIVPIGLALGLMVPIAVRNFPSAILMIVAIAVISAITYSGFYPAPTRTISALQFGGYVFLWALWYTFHTRKRLMREGPRG